jgi:hypothetical protein
VLQQTNSRLWSLVVVIVMAGAGCSTTPSPSFSLSNATVDATHACPSGALDATYGIKGTISVNNATAQAVTIESVSAVMTLSAVHGRWLQPVGYKYNPGAVQFTPDSVGASSSAVLKLTIPSECTNIATTPGKGEYADYAIDFVVTTSTGTFKLDSKNTHRIAAA